MSEIQTLRMIVKEIESSGNEGKLIVLGFFDELSHFFSVFIDIFDGENLDDITGNINQLLLSSKQLGYPINHIKVIRNEFINESNFEMLHTFMDWKNFYVVPQNVTLCDDRSNTSYIREFNDFLSDMKLFEGNYLIPRNNMLKKLSEKEEHYIFAKKYNVFMMNAVAAKIKYKMNKKMLSGTLPAVFADFEGKKTKENLYTYLVNKIKEENVVFGDYEIYVNIIDNKIGFFAVERQSRLWFTYANEFQKDILSFDVTVAFNLFFEFIKNNNLPIKSFRVVNNKTMETYPILKDKKFVKYINQYLNPEKIYLVNNEVEMMILTNETINIVNSLLVQNYIRVGQYGVMINESPIDYHDKNGKLVTKCTPKEYVQMYLNGVLN